MDKKPNRQEENNSRSESEADLDLMLQIVETEHQRIAGEIEDTLKSRLTRGKHRGYLMFFKALFDLTWLNAKRGISNIMLADSFERRLDNLENAVEDIAQKVQVDFSNIRSQIVELKKKTPKLPKHIREYLDEIRKDYEEYRAFMTRFFENNR